MKTKTFFELTHQDKDSSARRGCLQLAHGPVQTPVFMPVGTQASVKTLSCEEVEGLGYEIILGNTYHLFLRPGVDLLESMGGLHEFMSWKRSILTDSGGFQVFSLMNRRKVQEEGVTFTSHVDGARHLLTPENVTQTQMRMGVDIAMCLDECPPYPITESVARDMMERTLRWAQRCQEAWRCFEPTKKEYESFSSKEITRLFGIVQGSSYPALRQESARRTVEMGFPGYAIGGVSVGEPRDIFEEMLGNSLSQLPVDQPRYLMGVGKPPEILRAVERGVDMFDCVLPTRNGRNGQALTWQGPQNLRKKQFRDSKGPIDENCSCPVCARYSTGYISHLFRAGEYLALRLVSLHNLAFMIDFMRQIQQSIGSNQFASFKNKFFDNYKENTE